MELYLNGKKALVLTFMALFILSSSGYAQSLDDLIDKMDAKSIVSNYDKSFSENKEKNFAQDFLVFVTPWHRKGYEYAVQYAKKIDYICPVWFDLKSGNTATGESPLIIEGQHNVDRKWIQELKTANPKMKIYPRIYVNVQEHEKFGPIVAKLRVQGVADKIMSIIHENGDLFDGIMFDTPMLNYLKFLQFDLQGILLRVSEMLADMDKGIIFSFMTKLDGHINGLEKFILFAEKILIMTYDFQDKKHPQNPISPVHWIKENLDYVFDDLNLNANLVKQKIMFGMPMYGYLLDYGKQKKDAIINSVYIQMLQEENPDITFNEQYQECFVRIPAKKIEINYPCLKFIKKRIEIADYYEVGMFAWEAGQALDYFFELF